MPVSRWSASERPTGSTGTRRASERIRGQVEPFAALAAVFAVGLAVSLYATVLSDVDLGGSADGTAETTLNEVHRNVSEGNVVVPGKMEQAPTVPPTGYDANVTLTVGEETWRAGPVPPESASSASRQVSVRLAPGNVRPGRLTVVIWS